MKGIQNTRQLVAIGKLALCKYVRIDGLQWASAFAFNAFLSLFPLLILVIAIASLFLNPERASHDVIAYFERYIPINSDMQRTIFNTIASVIHTRIHAGLIALLLLIWVALQCFVTLILASNRAYGIQGLKIFALSVKSIALLAIAVGTVLVGMVSLVGTTMFGYWFFSLFSLLIPSLSLFVGLCLFYWISPQRPTQLTGVWFPALLCVAFFQISELVFMFLYHDLTSLNSIYGALGIVISFLLWFYISGCIIIFGSCLCSSIAEQQ